MPIGPVIPDCEIVLAPLEADLRVMVLGNELCRKSQTLAIDLALVFSEMLTLKRY